MGASREESHPSVSETCQRRVGCKCAKCLFDSGRAADAAPESRDEVPQPRPSSELAGSKRVSDRADDEGRPRGLQLKAQFVRGTSTGSISDDPASITPTTSKPPLYDSMGSSHLRRISSLRVQRSLSLEPSHGGDSTGPAPGPHETPGPALPLQAEAQSQPLAATAEEGVESAGPGEADAAGVVDDDKAQIAGQMVRFLVSGTGGGSDTHGSVRSDPDAAMDPASSGADEPFPSGRGELLRRTKPAPRVENQGAASAAAAPPNPSRSRVFNRAQREQRRPSRSMDMPRLPRDPAAEPASGVPVMAPDAVYLSHLPSPSGAVLSATEPPRSYLPPVSHTPLSAARWKPAAKPAYPPWAGVAAQQRRLPSSGDVRGRARLPDSEAPRRRLSPTNAPLAPMTNAEGEPLHPLQQLESQLLLTNKLVQEQQWVLAHQAKALATCLEQVQRAYGQPLPALAASEPRYSPQRPRDSEDSAEGYSTDTSMSVSASAHEVHA